MKRKIKKFFDGGIATQALTMAPSGGGAGGGLAGIQRSSQDIAQGIGMLERGTRQIKGGEASVGDTDSPGLYRQLAALGKTMTGSSPAQSDISAAMPYQRPANAIPLQAGLSLAGFKKGGAVKAKSKIKPKATKTTSKRGDFLAKRVKTRGNIV